METPFQRFFKSFTIVTLVIAIVSWLMDAYAPAGVITPWWPLLLLFLYLVTLLIFRMLSKQMNDRISRFSTMLMGVNFGKMFVYLIIILVFAWFDRAGALSFALTFMVYYALLTFVEIRALLKGAPKA